MSRVEIQPGDRLHWMIWRSTLASPSPWSVAPAKNGMPIDGSIQFATWAEALAHADVVVDPTP